MARVLLRNSVAISPGLIYRGECEIPDELYPGFVSLGYIQKTITEPEMIKLDDKMARIKNKKGF